MLCINIDCSTDEMKWIQHVLFSLQLGGFVEKYAGSGVSLHPQSNSNKENRRTEGLNRYLQTLQSNQSTAPGQRDDYYHVTHTLKTSFGDIAAHIITVTYDGRNMK